MLLRLLHTPRHERQTSRRVNRIDELLLVRRHPAGRRLHLNAEYTATRKHAEDIADTWSVRRDVRVARLDIDAGRVVLPAKDVLPIEIFEDGSLN